MKRKKIANSKLKAETTINEDQVDRILYAGIHRTGFVKLFLGYAMSVMRYDEYDDHIVAYFPEEMGLEPLYFSYNSDTDYVLMYADEVH